MSNNLDIINLLITQFEESFKLHNSCIGNAQNMEVEIWNKYHEIPAFYLQDNDWDTKFANSLTDK